MKETCQNLDLQRDPHQSRERLALVDRRDVRAINPLPVLDGTGIGGTFMRELLAGRGGDDRITGPGLPSTNHQSIGGVGAETGQETLGSTHGLEGLEVLGVDEGGEVVKLEGEGGGIDGLILSEIKPRLVILALPFIRTDGVDGRARVDWCGRVEGVSGGSDGGDRVGRGGVRRMIDGGIISGRCIWWSLGTRARVVSGAEQSQRVNYPAAFVLPKSRGCRRVGGGLGRESGRRGHRLMLVFVGRRPAQIRLKDNGTE